MAPAPPARAELDFKIPRSAFVYYVLEDIAGDDLKGTLAEPAAYEMVATERRLDHDGGWAPLAGGWRRQPVSLRIVRRRHGPAVLLTALGVDGGDEKLRDMRIVPVEAPVLSFKKVIYETVAADEGEQRECIFLLDINATMQLEAITLAHARTQTPPHLTYTHTRATAARHTHTQRTAHTLSFRRPCSNPMPSRELRPSRRTAWREGLRPSLRCRRRRSRCARAQSSRSG